jgi:hypothetical protein
MLRVLQLSPHLHYLLPHLPVLSLHLFHRGLICVDGLFELVLPPLCYPLLLNKGVPSFQPLVSAVSLPALLAEAILAQLLL